MKNKFPILYLLRKSLSKKHAISYEDNTHDKRENGEQAKVINLYQRNIPVVKHAKVISIFS